ncbi:MAG TPA: V-type ATP synthase subunit I [Planctomycetes bacterium]|nr:V-type ATP synthase subunit I [Planctomycetota bacterium]
MAVARMMKILIAAYRGEAAELLEQLQQAGIVELLDAERAMITKDWPELQIDIERPKDLEDMVGKLERSLAFLSLYATDKGPVSILQPRVVVNKVHYSEVVSGVEAGRIGDEAGQLEAEIERLGTELENLQGTFETLLPWRQLPTPPVEMCKLKTATCITGLVGYQHFEEVAEKLYELGAAVEQVGATSSAYACVIVCMNESAGEVQKVLRSGDFEPARFEGITGTVNEFLTDCERRLEVISSKLSKATTAAAKLAKDRLKLQILYDHYQNLLAREQAKATSPATENVMLFEGWVRRKDYPQVAEIVGSFSASTVTEVLPGEGEEPPVEIENRRGVRPFEVITRLYGMPHYLELDPTAFLAPFFAIFFGLCMTDAGYGLLMIAGSLYFLRKVQGDKKFARLMVLCSVTTIIAGALTGGWFGDAIQLLNVGPLVKARAAILKFGFDPMEKPQIFFVLALVIGYFQLQFGLAIAFFDKLLRKDYVGAMCEHLSLMLMLNLLVAYLFGGKVGISEPVRGILLKTAFVPAVIIFVLSHREGGWAARLGMGFFNLFSTIFYIGDTLSYVRLMALGMVTAGFATAINQMARMAGEVKYIGIVLAIVVLLGGHLFNIFISGLGAFVHTLRLQYVEFFPKFFEGGGKMFEPFAKRYRHIYVNKEAG